MERLTHHVSLNAWYTWSHTFDSVQLDNNTAQGLVEDFRNPKLHRGAADFDMRHQAVLSLIFQSDYYHRENSFVGIFGIPVGYDQEGKADFPDHGHDEKTPAPNSEKFHKVNTSLFARPERHPRQSSRWTGNSEDYAKNWGPLGMRGVPALRNLEIINVLSKLQKTSRDI